MTPKQKQDHIHSLRHELDVRVRLVVGYGRLKRQAEERVVAIHEELRRLNA